METDFFVSIGRNGIHHPMNRSNTCNPTAQPTCNPRNPHDPNTVKLHSCDVSRQYCCHSAGKSICNLGARGSGRRLPRFPGTTNSRRSRATQFDIMRVEHSPIDQPIHHAKRRPKRFSDRVCVHADTANAATNTLRIPPARNKHSFKSE